jgi:hypothetical protein
MTPNDRKTKGRGGLDEDVALAVPGERQTPGQRARRDAGGEHDGARGHGLVLQVHLPQLDGAHRGVDADAHARASGEDPGGVASQRGGHLRHDAVGGMKEVEADLVAPYPRVVAHDLVGEGGHLAEQLRSHQAAADHRESEEKALALSVGLHVGALETFDHVVAQDERVGESLEGEGGLRSRDQTLVGSGAQSQDEVVVGQLVGGALARHGAHEAALEVDLLYRRLDEAGAPQEVAQRQRAVPQLERAREGFEEQRRHEEEIVAADQDDLGRRTAAASGHLALQVAGRPDAAEAAAENQDAGAHDSHLAPNRRR